MLTLPNPDPSVTAGTEPDHAKIIQIRMQGAACCLYFALTPACFEPPDRYHFSVSVSEIGAGSESNTKIIHKFLLSRLMTNFFPTKKDLALQHCPKARQNIVSETAYLP